MPSPITYRPGITPDGLSPNARAMLDALSARTGLPGLTVTSTHRDPFGNAQAGGAKGSQHIFGNAVDLDVSGLNDQQKAELLDAAVAGGARGVGIYTSGNVIHLDTRANPATWGANPSAPYAGVSPEQQPAWARPTLQRLAAGGGGTIPPPPALATMRSTVTDAAKQFGVSENLMLWMAQRESRFNPNAKNPDSSATGLFQITGQTWADASRIYGQKLGMPAGTPPTDPKWNAIMAAALVKENQLVMGKMLGREATEGELYLGHFLGGRKAIDMIAAAENTPDAPAAAMFPGEAAVNGSIFFDKAGQPRSVAQVYANMTNIGTTAPGEGQTPVSAEAPKTQDAKQADTFDMPATAKATGVQPALQQMRGPSNTTSELDIFSQRVGANRQARGLMG